MLFNNSRNVPTNQPTPRPVVHKVDPETTSPAVDPTLWAEAEKAVRNKNGGFAGVSEEGKRAQIQDAYDQIGESRDKARAWEG